MKTLLVAVLLLALCPGCRSPSSAGGCAEARPTVDAAVMAFLSAARALHHEADMDERSGDRNGAIGALERLVALPPPNAVEADEVLADAHARLAELRLAGGALDPAASEVERGLARAPGATYFRGHLLEVRGLIEESRSSALADAGRVAEAARARARAMELLEQAVRVQEQVIAAALADGGLHD